MEAMYHPPHYCAVFIFRSNTSVYYRNLIMPFIFFPLRLALLSSWTWASLSIIAIVVIRFILIFNATCNKQRQLC